MPTNIPGMFIVIMVVVIFGFVGYNAWNMITSPVPTYVQSGDGVLTTYNGHVYDRYVDCRMLNNGNWDTVYELLNTTSNDTLYLQRSNGIFNQVTPDIIVRGNETAAPSWIWE